jgi:hypothetical protein
MQFRESVEAVLAVVANIAPDIVRAGSVEFGNTDQALVQPEPDVQGTPAPSASPAVTMDHRNVLRANGTPSNAPSESTANLALLSITPPIPVASGQAGAPSAQPLQRSSSPSAPTTTASSVSAAVIFEQASEFPQEVVENIFLYCDPESCFQYV